MVTMQDAVALAKKVTHDVEEAAFSTGLSREYLGLEELYQQAKQFLKDAGHGD